MGAFFTLCVCLFHTEMLVFVTLWVGVFYFTVCVCVGGWVCFTLYLCLFVSHYVCRWVGVDVSH